MFITPHYYKVDSHDVKLILIPFSVLVMLHPTYTMITKSN